MRQMCVLDRAMELTASLCRAFWGCMSKPIGRRSICHVDWLEVMDASLLESRMWEGRADCPVRALTM